MTQRDWQKDMAFILREKERVQIFHLDTKEEDIAIHWLQEAKERGERVKQLEEALEKIKSAVPNPFYHIAKYALEEGERSRNLTLPGNTLYPDTQAPTGEERGTHE